jgi:hypothetical protein
VRRHAILSCPEVVVPVSKNSRVGRSRAAAPLQPDASSSILSESSHRLVPDLLLNQHDQVRVCHTNYSLVNLFSKILREIISVLAVVMYILLKFDALVQV